MKEFHCPYCNERLSHFNGTIIKMKGVMKCGTFECISNIYLPGALGHYDALVDDHVKLEPGVTVDFRCPNLSCNRSFTTEYDDDLAEIKMIDEDQEYAVVFNRIYGRHATYLVDYKKKKLQEAYGEHRRDYLDEFEKPLNFFGQ